MTIKLVSIFLSLSLFLSSAECGSEQFRRSQKRTVSKKTKYIIAAALAVAATAGTAVAVANLAPEHYPEILRPYMPSFLLCESAQQVFSGTKPPANGDNNATENHENSVNQHDDLPENQNLISDEMWERIESGINDLKEQVNRNLSDEEQIKYIGITQKLSNDLNCTISYKKNGLDKNPNNPNPASSLSRHIKNVFKNYNELCQQVPSLQQSNETQELFAEMKTFAQALDNKFGNAEHYWLGHESLH